MKPDSLKLRAVALRAAAPAMLSLAALWLMRDALAHVDLAAAISGAADAAAWQWLAALVATLVTFLAFGRSEIAVHRWLGTGRDPAAAARSGMAALAVAQVTGLGPLVGLLVRWHCDPRGGWTRAAAITALASLSFLACLGGLASASVLLTGTGGPFLALAAALCLLALGGVVAASIALRHIRVLPPLPVLGGLALWGCVDALAACAAYWAFVPEIALPQIAPAFFLALGSGLLSALPGGLGSFDLCLTHILPATQATTIEGASTAFRLVHFVLPAGLAAAALLVRPALFSCRSRPAALTSGMPLPPLRRAEAGLLHQPGARLLGAQDRPVAVCWTSSHALIALGLPFAGPTPLHALRDAAVDCGRLALAYKIGARDAVAARSLGWTTMRVGAEALLDLDQFDSGAPGCRQLRRKLRKATRAGLRIASAAPSELASLAPLDARWQARQGRARGVSMGQFERQYLSRQLVLIAWDGPRAVAFISLHLAPGEWTLDVTRWDADAPDGTLHLLVVEAIALGRKAGVAQLSLAAVPRCDPSGSAGLRRFKGMFDPRWVPLYAAAPSAAGLALAMADLGRDILNPPHPHSAQHDHESSEFARTAVS